MKIVCLLMCCMFVLCLVGCLELTPTQEARIDELKSRNDALKADLEALMAKAKTGEITALEAFVAGNQIQDQINANIDELRDIAKTQGFGLWEVIGLIGMALFGRSPLHKLNKIPGVKFLLGGSK